MTDNETHTPPTAARQTTTGTSSRADHTTTVRPSFFPTLLLSPCPPIPDTDSDADVYGQKFVPSTESLGPPRMGISESSTPTFVDSNGMPAVREPYPAWSSERQIPLSKEEIEDIFLDLTQKFGFQRDSMRNMVRYLSHAPRICFPALPSALPCQPRWCSRDSETWPSNPKPCVLHAKGEARRLCPGTVRPLSARSKHVAEFLASVLAFILSGC